MPESTSTDGGVAEDGFLSRWSRLKSQPAADPKPTAVTAPMDSELDTTATTGRNLEQSRQLEPASSLPTAAADLPASESADSQPLADPEPLTDADMPDIETLDERSDFSGFLSESVSEHLRRKALKKLFHLPEFNIRDGLNEYDEDYSKFIPLGDTVTYQMKQFIERQKQDFKDALNDEEPVDPATDSTEAACTNGETGVGQSAEQKAVSKPGFAQQPSPDEPDEDDLGACE